MFFTQSGCFPNTKAATVTAIRQLKFGANDVFLLASSRLQLEKLELFYSCCVLLEEKISYNYFTKLTAQYIK